ncbi:low molecular weight phosphatase family protein [Zhihengliuella halotolerans]|uniref:Protein-tyrosine-phosphatase n=1 Tax=Zhihengliuella halotolerans TaxID=370736 RepID=A0A4Q8AHN1_9MICC|nr:arsenate reductase ArsC [Zhihengliuella halotolerans]RZU63325.1 protein-tyrosine-phosphatase [Zhihengliuella halotolerans]
MSNETPARNTSTPNSGNDRSTMDRHVLMREVNHLAARYRGIFAPEMIERYLFESYTTLSRSARVRTYLAATATHFTADRLHALAQSMGAAPKDQPEVLFVCVENAGRSQLAAAFMRKIGGDAISVRSAGSNPSAELHPVTLYLMQQRGLPTEGLYPKPLTDDVVRAADVVVTMGCGDACPIYPDKQYTDWDLDDLRAVDEAGAEAVAEDIERRVTALWEELRNR